MSDLIDPWHFPRPELAQAYLGSFDLGLTSARGLFARRRMGKSEFLKHDLLPAALPAGYLAAPFYNWAPLEPFPLLGRQFVVAVEGDARVFFAGTLSAT